VGWDVPDDNRNDRETKHEEGNPNMPRKDMPRKDWPADAEIVWESKVFGKTFQ
jgi:hypothetical protein